jgi:hypothetical protein
MSDITIVLDNVISLAKDEIRDSKEHVRLNNHLLKSFKRNQAIVIKNLDTNAYVLRYVRGSNGLRGLTKSTLACDYDTIIELGITDVSAVRLSVEKASLWHIVHSQWNHQNAAIRFNFRIAIIAFVLGLLAFI